MKQYSIPETLNQEEDYEHFYNSDYKREDVVVEEDEKLAPYYKDSKE